MYVILGYDITTKEKKSNSNKIRKLVEKYLSRVQYSFYEGEITGANFKVLKTKLDKLVDKESDSILIYVLGNLKYTEKIILGQDKLNNIFS